MAVFCAAIPVGSALGYVLGVVGLASTWDGVGRFICYTTRFILDFSASYSVIREPAGRPPKAERAGIKEYRGL
jgi:hypothetical protein